MTYKRRKMNLGKKKNIAEPSDRVPERDKPIPEQKKADASKMPLPFFGLKIIPS
jgi:hypothetical protein